MTAINHPSVLRIYAAIFESPPRDPLTGKLMVSAEACAAAAKALRYQAEALDRLKEY